jgi:heterodisulfide reductase subunit A
LNEEDTRVGIFVCHCGVNIGGFVDVPDVAEYAKTLPNVVHAENNLYTCADDGLTAIKTAIKEKNLNRVIVASCTPRTHAPLFMRICEEAGLNKYLFTFVNIREHCSWVHMKEKERGTEKAKDLIKMGVARAVLLEPQKEVKIEVRPSSLVIGGGIAGMTAALNLANQGFETHLIEKENELGGFVRNLDTLYQTGESAQKSIEPLIEKVKNNQNIKLYTSTTLKALEGYIGKYDAVLNVNGEDKEIGVGTIIVATGAEEHKPKDLYGLGEFENVVTLTDFEEMVRENRLPSDLKNVAFITCAGSRGQDKEYCSRVCCTVTVKNAMKLMDKTPDAEAKVEERVVEEKTVEPEEEKQEEPEEETSGRRSRRERRGRRDRRGRRGADRGEEKPRERGARSGMDVTVFNRGITTYGVEQELMYNTAREKRVKFVRFVPENPPKVTMEDGKLTLSYYHATLQADRKVNPDLIVLATPLTKQEGSEELSKMLKVPLGRDGFFLEAHVKLRPVDFATDGIFLCGTAHGPANIHEAVAQAYGSASHASIPMGKGYVQAEAIVSHVDPERCSGCRSCEVVCPYSSIKFDEDGIAEIVVAACKGCGTCGSICPEKAISMTHYTDEQITAEAIAALEVN